MSWHNITKEEFDKEIEELRRIYGRDLHDEFSTVHEPPAHRFFVKNQPFRLLVRWPCSPSEEFTYCRWVDDGKY